MLFLATHNPEIDLNGTYINTGAWVDDHTNFVEINDTEISLCNVRTKRKIRMIDKIEL